jgi:hypothetical protein
MKHPMSLCSKALPAFYGARHAFSTCYALCFAASCAQLLGDVERAAKFADEAIREGNRQGI